MSYDIFRSNPLGRKAIVRHPLYYRHLCTSFFTEGASLFALFGVLVPIAFSSGVMFKTSSNTVPSFSRALSHFCSYFFTMRPSSLGRTCVFREELSNHRVFSGGKTSLVMSVLRKGLRKGYTMERPEHFAPCFSFRNLSEQQVRNEVLSSKQRDEVVFRCLAHQANEE